MTPQRQCLSHFSWPGFECFGVLASLEGEQGHNTLDGGSDMFFLFLPLWVWLQGRRSPRGESRMGSFPGRWQLGQLGAAWGRLGQIAKEGGLKTHRIGAPKITSTALKGRNFTKI